MLDEILCGQKKQLNIELSASRTVLDHLAENGFDPTYGARPLRRAIQNEVEDAPGGSYFGDEKIQEGDHIQLSMKKGRIDFS